MYPYCSEKNNDIMPPVGEDGKKEEKTLASPVSYCAVLLTVAVCE